jgi:2-polyprenyl-6-hydroxyphenyl methylase/3-demethylubiquinone-9 3-methyltransferase
MSSTIDQNEVEKFAKIADEWWNEEGKFKPLHKFNPIRIAYLRENIIKHFHLDSTAAQPLKNLKILDIGCGGGLLCEPLSRLGAQMTGIDAAGIEVPMIHAKKSGLNIDYRNIDVEELANSAEKFDVVLAMEVIEHVADIDNFVKAAANCLKPEGIIFIATLNRTIKSFLSAIIGAEYVLRWLPVGTHSWKKFLKPSEINKIATGQNLKLIELKGFEYNLLKDSWKKSDNLEINYIMIFNKI